MTARWCAACSRSNLAQDAIFDPMVVPPFFRIDLSACNHHAEVHVIAERHAGCAADANLLLFAAAIADFHQDLAHMPLQA